MARSRGRLKGKQPKLSARQQAGLVRMRATGEYTIADLMEVFSVGRHRLPGPGARRSRARRRDGPGVSPRQVGPEGRRARLRGPGRLPRRPGC